MPHYLILHTGGTTIADGTDNIGRADGNVLAIGSTGTIYTFRDTPGTTDDGQNYWTTGDGDGGLLHLLPQTRGILGQIGAILASRAGTRSLRDEAEGPLTGVAEYTPDDGIGVDIYDLELDPDCTVGQDHLPTAAGTDLLAAGALLRSAGYSITGPWTDHGDGADLTYRARIAIADDLPPYNPFPRP